MKNLDPEDDQKLGNIFRFLSKQSSTYSQKVIFYDEKDFFSKTLRSSDPHEVQWLFYGNFHYCF